MDRSDILLRFAECRTEDEKIKGTTRGTDANRDPITGAPGAHPVGTGVGAAGAGAAGAAIGMALGGPVGSAIGAVAGAISGGLAGKAAAEAIDPTREDAYWRENYGRQTWADRTYTYDDYQPAFKTGYEGYGRYARTGKTYDQAESDLQRDFERAKGKSRLGWDQAKSATRAAWHRVHDNAERAIPGDSDHDGK